MDLDRVFLNAQVDRDHLIEFVVGNQTDNFLFTLRERLKGAAHHVDTEFFFSRFYILIRQPTHGLTQTLGFDGLLAEVARTFLQCHHRHGDIAVPGQKNNRQINPAPKHFVLKFQPVHFGHAHIENHAAWHTVVIVLKKCQGTFVGHSFDACHTQRKNG